MHVDLIKYLYIFLYFFYLFCSENERQESVLLFALEIFRSNRSSLSKSSLGKVERDKHRHKILLTGAYWQSNHFQLNGEVKLLLK